LDLFFGSCQERFWCGIEIEELPDYFLYLNSSCAVKENARDENFPLVRPDKNLQDRDWHLPKIDETRMMMKFRDLKAGDCVVKVGWAERETITMKRGMFSTLSMTFWRGEILTVLDIGRDDDGHYHLRVQRNRGMDDFTISADAQFATHFDHFFQKL
jgi:hypothetical protein